MKDNNKHKEYILRNKIKEYVHKQIEFELNTYHNKFCEDIGFLLYYPLYYFEHDLYNNISKVIQEYVRTSSKEGTNNGILTNLIIPSIQVDKMKNLKAISWFIQEMKNRGYKKARRFKFDDFKLESFDMIYESILAAYRDYEICCNIHKFNDIAGYRFIEESLNEYLMIKQNVVDNHSKELIYFYGLYDKEFDKEKEVILKVENYIFKKYNIVFDMISGKKRNYKEKYQTIQKLDKKVDMDLYKFCVDRVKLDLLKLTKDFKSEIVEDNEEFAQFIGYFYYLSRVNILSCNTKELLLDDYKKDILVKVDYYKLIDNIGKITGISIEKIKKYIKYYTFDDKVNRYGTLREFPLIRYKNRLIFMPSTFILNDYQFSVTDGHNLKSIDIINKKDTISTTIEDNIEKEVSKYDNIIIAKSKKYNIESTKRKNGQDLKSDIDIALYDKLSNNILIIECKWKENFYRYSEYYPNIIDGLKKAFSEQLDKHKEFIELDYNNINYIFDYHPDVVKSKGKITINYLFIDKRIQYHYKDKHMLSIYLFLYLVSQYCSNNKFFLDQLVAKINTFNTQVSDEVLVDKKILKIEDLLIMHNALNLNYEFDITIYDEFDEEWMDEEFGNV